MKCDIAQQVSTHCHNAQPIGIATGLSGSRRPVIGRWPSLGGMPLPVADTKPTNLDLGAEALRRNALSQVLCWLA